MVGLRDLYAEYSEQVQFLVIYIREAHPDDGWVLKETGVTDSTTIEERRDVAETCQAAMQYGIVIYVDEMDDAVMLAYAAWPERLYLIDKDGQIAYAGSKGPWGFEPVELKQAIEQNAGGYCLALEYRAPPRRPAATPAPALRARRKPRARRTSRRRRGRLLIMTEYLRAARAVRERGGSGRTHGRIVHAPYPQS